MVSYILVNTDWDNGLWPILHQVITIMWLTMEGSHVFVCFNLLWPSDVISWHESGSTLPQVMACTKSLPELILTYHQWSSVAFSYAQNQGKCSRCYRQTSDISCTLVGNKIVDHSDVVGASPFGAAPTISLFSTEHLASIYWVETAAGRGENHLSLGIWCTLY